MVVIRNANGRGVIEIESLYKPPQMDVLENLPKWILVGTMSRVLLLDKFLLFFTELASLE
jgi:hypothetical protein